MGETRIAEITYTLPFTVDDVVKNGYTLLIQRQSGSRIQAYAFDSVLTPGESYEWVYPNAEESVPTTFHWNSPSFQSDAVLGFILRKHE